MSGPGTAKVFVVSDSGDAVKIAAWLAEEGFAAVRHGDGGDETLAALQEDPAQVVVLAASLTRGDALAFAGAVRSEGAGGHTPAIVLIGDERGPVRTALDAIDFRADCFLRRPLARAALIYAVRSCAGLGPARPAAPNGSAAALRAQGSSPPVAPAPLTVAPAPSSSVAPAPSPPPVAPEAASTGSGSRGIERLSMAMEEAIDAFLHEAVEDVLAHTPLDEVDLEGAPREAPETPAYEAYEAVSVEPEDASASAEGALQPEPSPADGDGIEPSALPPWREPTQILSGATPDPAAPGRSQPVAELLAQAGFAPPPAATDSPAPVAPDEARTGTFVSELKRTMSAIGQRLFGDEGTAAAAPYDEAAPDIDLDAIAVDSTIPGVTFDDDRRRGGPPSGARPAPLPLDEDEPPVRDETGSGERRTTSPRASAPGTRGDLREDDVAFLIARLHREGFTGRVTFRRGEAAKSLFFEEGRLVFATSNLPHDRMGDLLYREGKITREQHLRSREIVAETGRRMGEILVEMGFLKRRELLPAVRRHVEDVVYSLFAWEAGGFSIVPGDGAQDEKIRLATHPTALVLEGIRRKVGLDRLRERIGPAGTLVAPLKRDEIAGVLAEADLSPEERQAADLFDGRRTIGELVQASRLDEVTVYQLAHGLIALGLARLVETRADTDAGRAPVGASSLAGAGDAAIDRERVLAKHAHVLEADYFAVLGVRRDATAFEVRRAYESARRDYATEAFAPEVQREHASQLRDIAMVLDEAYRVLKDDRVRALYLKNLRE